MGDYTEFLRIQSQNHENRRKKKNKKLKRLNDKNHRRLRTMNDYTLAPLEYAGLYAPGTPTGEVGKSFDPYQPRGRDGRWIHIGGFSEQDVEDYWGYSSDGHSMDISPMLRGHDMPYTDPNDEEEMAVLHGVVGAMDKIGNGWELKEPMSVYRIAPLGDLKEGDEITDPAFMSTTEHGAILEGYRTNADDTLLRIDLPKGFRAIPHHGEWGNGAKGEVILPRGTRLRVKGKEGKFTVVEPVNVSKKFNPDEPRDENGRWTLAAAVAHLLGEAEEEDVPYPEVDRHEPWKSISYNGKQMSSDHVETYGTSSGLKASAIGKREHEAMSEYVAYDKDTTEINKRLRNGEPLDAEHESRNKVLDSIAGKASLSQDTDMYRSAVLSDDQYNSLVKGAGMTDPGYASFSPSREVADYYANERHNGEGRKVIFHLRGKKGDSIIPARNDEWVVPRGTNMMVTRKSGNVVEVRYA